MPKHIVCLTYDFDGISGFIARGQTGPSWYSRGEFGPRVGAPRLLDVFRRHGIRTSWYVPGHTIETFPEAVRKVVEAGHEIAHHGWTHRSPAALSREKEEAELVRANESIRAISGRYARGYRSPSWDLSPHSVALLLKHGFIYDSSMMGDDYAPYYARQGDTITLNDPAVFGRASALVEMPIHWSTDDSPHFEYFRQQDTGKQGLHRAGGVLEDWLADYLHMRETTEWGALTITCHPFISGRGHRVLMLEKLIARLRENGAVFQRVDETVDEWRALHPTPQPAAPAH